MSDLIPEIVLDKLWQGACLSSYHPDGDQRFKLLNYGRAVVTETLARLPGWQSGNPDIPKGTEREFIVAVRRKYNGKVFVFGATFAHHYENDMHTDEGNEFIADGWYHQGLDSSGEFDRVYRPILDHGDEVVGWQHLPKWSEPE